MRALRLCTAVVAVLAVLFVVADRIAVHLAEEEAAEQVTRSEGLTGTESAAVEIKGFPFLTQVLGKELDEVDVELRGMTAKAGDRRITVTRVDARLTRLHLGGDFSTASAERASGTASISYADLNEIAPSGVKVSYPGKDRARRGQVRLSAAVNVLGRDVQLPRPVYSSVRITGNNRVELRADRIPTAGIPGAEGQIRKLVDFGRTVRGLPSGLTLDRTKVTREGIAFTLAGEDVKLAG